MGRAWDDFKTGVGDQIRGGMKYGLSSSVSHNYRAMKAAQAEREANEGARYPRPSRKDGYYSQMRPADPSVVELFIGKDGDITSERPHVHIIHNPTEGKIIITATQRDGRHSSEEVLPIDASGNQVNSAVDRLRRTLK